MEGQLTIELLTRLPGDHGVVVVRFRDEQGRPVGFMATLDGASAQVMQVEASASIHPLHGALVTH